MWSIVTVSKKENGDPYVLMNFGSKNTHDVPYCAHM